MYELAKTKEVNRLIRITKSDSGVSGPQLALAHMRLGELLARGMGFCPSDTTVVAVLRGGIFFAEGVYFGLNCKFQLFNPREGGYVRPDTEHVVVVDSVVNTGSTVRGILDKQSVLACCVINEKAVPEFEDRLFTVRVSKNSFVGAAVGKQQDGKGPDTTMRLFNLI